MHSEKIASSKKKSKQKAIIKNTQNCTNERKFSKGLDCLPSSALFNVVSSTSINLNVPETAGLLEFLTSPFLVCSD